MLVSEIATRVKRTFGDENGAQISSADIYRWINDAMRDIAINNNVLQVSATLATTANTPSLSIPAGILKMHSVRWLGIPLQGLSVQEADELIAGPGYSAAQGYPVGTPTHYWLFAGKINLYPAPVADGTTDLVLYYTKVPTEVAADGDTPELPVQYHNRLVEYCVAMAQEIDGNLEAYQMKMSQFSSNVNDLKSVDDWRTQEFYPSITPSVADTGDF